jgi:hypothetical protein
MLVSDLVTILKEHKIINKTILQTEHTVVFDVKDNGLSVLDISVSRGIKDWLDVRQLKLYNIEDGPTGLCISEENADGHKRITTFSVLDKDSFIIILEKQHFYLLAIRP